MTVTPPVADEVRASEPIDSSGAPLSPEFLEPVQYWSDIDPDYEEIPGAPDDDIDDPEEDLTEEEAEPPETDVELLPFWVSYEMHGRNLDEGSPWAQLATADFDGDLEVEVEGLTAGARWEFRLRLTDRFGRHSRWSEPLQIDLPTDFTPPPAPTAPLVENVYGHTIVGWDGLLVDETPGDMSHVQGYVRQMHPASDPEGEPGDPRKVFTLREAGETPLMQFLADVLHEVFFTAVDTTGNESPWSEAVEFTPTPPVDTDTIRGELEDAEERLEQAIQQAREDFENFEVEWNEEWDEEHLQSIRDRQDTLEGDLITGLDDVYRDAQAYAEAQADDAVNRAAADAQSEYDRLQEIAEEALREATRNAENLYPNGSFEDTTGGGLDFSTTATIVSDSRARSGDHVLSVVHDGTFGWTARGEYAPTAPSTTYYASMWVMRTTEEASGQIGLRGQNIDDGSSIAFWYNQYQYSSGGPGSGVSASDLPRNEWVHIWGTYTIPEDGRDGHRIYPHTLSSGSTEYLIDDVEHYDVTSAAGPIGMAGRAWAEAYTAHQEAGRALDNAAVAYDTASSKNSIHWSLSAPSGTGSDGDTWWQYTNLSGSNRRQVVGQWHWDNGWQQDELSSEVLAELDAGIITFGSMHGDRIEANTVTTKHLTVTNTDNLFSDEWLLDVSDTDYVYSPGGVPESNAATSRFQAESPPTVDRDAGGNVNWEFATVQGLRGFQFRPAWADGTNQRIAFRLGQGKGIMVRPGDEFTFRAVIRDIADSGNFWAYMGLYDVVTGDPASSSNRLSFNMRGIVNSGPDDETVWHFTIPDDYPQMYMVPQFMSPPAGDENQGRSVLRPSLHRANNGRLTVDGSILARALDVQDLSADSAFLNALEVDLLKGRLAVLDEAIIGRNLIQDRAITVGKLAVIPDIEDYAPNPGQYPELWDMLGATLASTPNNPTGVTFRFGQRSSNTQIRGPWRPVTPGKQIRFRGRYTWWGSSATGATVSVRMEWSDTPEGSRDSFSTFLTVPSGTSGSWVEGTVTVPEDAAYGCLHLYQASTTGSDAGFRGNIECEPMVGAVLIEDGAITAEKLYVTEQMVARFGQFLKISVDQLDFNEMEGMTLRAGYMEGYEIRATDVIGSHFRTSNTPRFDGGVSINQGLSGGYLVVYPPGGRELIAYIGDRPLQWTDIDGTQQRVERNYFKGSLFAGPNREHGLNIDYGELGVTSGWSDEEEPPEIIRTSITPYIEFRTDFNHLITPKIFVDERDGGLDISPGREVGTPSGSGIVRLWGTNHVNKLISRHLDVPTTSGVQPGGMRRDGGRTRLMGRMPNASGGTDMFSSGSLGPYTPSSGRYRGSFNWAVPPAQGNRPLLTSGRVTRNATVDYWRGAIASWSIPTSPSGGDGSTADGARFTLLYQDGSGGQQMWFHFMGRWE